MVQLWAQQPRFYHYTVDKGLSSSTIYRIFCDSKGYIWIGSNVGIDRFNGRAFKYFDNKDGMPDSKVIEFYEDREHRLWGLTVNGKVFYVQNDKVCPPPFSNRLKDRFVNGIIQNSSGDFYFSVDYARIFHLHNFKLAEIFHTLGEPYVMRMNSEGTLAVPSARSLSFIKGNKLGIHKFPDFSKVRPRISVVDDHFYITCNEGILDCKDTNCRLVDQPYFSSKGIEVFDMVETRNGHLWCGTKQGVYEFDNVRMNTTPRHFLENEMVSTVCEDKEGNMWLGTLENGIYFLSSQDYLTYDTKSGLYSDNLYSVAGYGDVVYAGDNTGTLYKIDKGKLKTFNLRKTGSLNRITSIWPLSENEVLIGSDQAFFYLKGDQVKSNPDITSVKQIMCVHDTAYISTTAQGLMVIRLSEILEIKDKYRYFPDILGLSSACRFNGKIYFAKSPHIYMYDGKHLTDMKVPVGDGTSRLCVSDDGTLWIVTSGKGVFIVQNGRITNLTVGEGLSSNYCNSLFVRGNVAYIATTNKGINKIEHTGGRFIVSRYRYWHGLASDEVNDIYVDSVGKIWAATNRGLTNFTPKKSTQPYHPYVNIESIAVNNRDYPLDKDYILPADSDNFTIRFAGVVYRVGEEVTYRYKLIGYDTAWHSVTDPLATYASVPAGTYLFSVSAVLQDTIESAHPATIMIVVKKSLMQLWWMRTLLVLAGLIVIAVIVYVIIEWIRRRERYNYEIKRQVRESEIKALRSQMNPHFLFNAMNSIQHYILENDKSSANRYIGKFALLMRKILNNAKHKSISLKEEEEFLHLYLETEALRFENKLKFEIRLENIPDPENVYMPSMLIQPFVENAIKHGITPKHEGGTVTVIFDMVDDMIRCRIQDDGIGRQEAARNTALNAAAHTGTGISSTIERVRLLYQDKVKKATISMTDLYDEIQHTSNGMLIEIVLPLEEMAI